MVTHFVLKYMFLFKLVLFVMLSKQLHKILKIIRASLPDALSIFSISYHNPLQHCNPDQMLGHGTDLPSTVQHGQR